MEPASASTEDGSPAGHPVSGILLMLLAGVALGSMGALIKFTGKRLPVYEVVFFRCLFLLLPLACYYGWTGRRPRVGNRKLLFARCLAGCSAMFLYFWTIVRLELATATVLNKTSPVWVVLFAIALLSEEAAWAVPALVLLAFGGCWLLIGPDFSSAVRSPVPGLVGLGSGILGALAYICLRQLRETDEPVDIVLCFTLFSGAVCLPPLVVGFVAPTGRELLALCGVGFAAALGQVCMTTAYQRERAAVVAPFFYSSVLVAALHGYLFWGERLDGTAAAGVTLVVVAGVALSLVRAAGKS